MKRGRILILLALVILAVVVVVVVITMQGGSSSNGANGADGEGGGEPSQAELIPTATPIPMTYVVLSAQNLPRGFRITRDAVDIKLWPIQSGVQENAFVLPTQYTEDGFVSEEEKDQFLNPVINENSPVGQVTRTRIVRWQPILTSMVVKDLFEAGEDVGSQTSAILPSGYVAVSLPFDMLGGVAYAMADGDRVDVIVSFLYVDVDETFQSIEPNRQSLVSISAEGGFDVQSGVSGKFEASSILGVPVIIQPVEDQRPRLVTQRTIQNALVIHVGAYPDGGEFLGILPTPTPDPAMAEAAPQTSEEGVPVPTPVPPRPYVVTLGVRPQEALVLVWAIEEQIPMTMALRSAADHNAADAPTQAVSLEYMVQNYDITRPARLDYALEPRITEVRSINSMLREQNQLWFIDITSGRNRGGSSSSGSE